MCVCERESMKTVCPYLFVLIRTFKLITQCDGSQLTQ